MFTHFRSRAIPCKKNIICQFAMCLPGTNAPFHNEQYLDWQEEPVDYSHLKGIACYTQLNSSRLSANKLILEQIRSSNKYTNSLEISWNLTFGALTPSWKERSEKRPAVWVWEDCALPCKTSDQGLPCWRTHIYFSTCWNNAPHCLAGWRSTSPCATWESTVTDSHSKLSTKRKEQKSNLKIIYTHT